MVVSPPTLKLAPNLFPNLLFFMQLITGSFPMLHLFLSLKLYKVQLDQISDQVQISVKSIKKLPFGDLLIETATQAQSINLLQCTNLSNISITATPHKTLNSSKGVIYCPDLIPLPDSEIEGELASQGVEADKRITSIKDGKTVTSPLFILTFSKHTLPENILIGYLNIKIRPYIPNPLRCFHCQSYGHGTASCCGVATYNKCSVTICNVYLPPNAPLNFRELQELIDQLPSPFILLGDFNAHHLLWGCQDVNSRGKVVEKLLAELDLTLLNDGSNTYFHSPTQSYSSDHFPVVISYATPIACVTLRQQRWKFDQADWETFRTQADITEDMVSSGLIDEVVSLVTSCILSAANNAISQPSSRLPHFPKPWWNEECQMAKKDQNKAWDQFRRYPPPDNMIAFNKARARARKIHRQRKRELWIKYKGLIPVACFIFYAFLLPVVQLYIILLCKEKKLSCQKEK
ncbi:RNA-directed DNA polymerase from mobile element jockey [Trichonephila inaurata madagascariensis]|uniref:RNA-directed DNA polymerase from mobile element jockey n=1 Tax=Trichonephila inaurata madagascariensis TaxID=2747483 RepID=A0A8X7CRD9_9ARAC|nr:RNA-directed DNA polymerase from mobile element jockey [Trichonephila inaurata madagascariensis]